MRSLFQALLLLVAMLSSFAAFSQTEFEATKELAEQGDVEAQVNLGAMYALGIGVAENDQEGVRWYKLAAGQGDVRSQQLLGYMYEEGEGVAQNFHRAYIWFSVSAAQGDADAAIARDRIRTLLSQQALEQAQAQATRCFESEFKDCE